MKKKEPKDRAFIIRFVSTNDLIDLILKMGLPNEKTPIVKGNRDFRVFVRSEFHALKWLINEAKINPDKIESIFAFNS